MAAAAIVIAFAFLAQPCVANRGHGALGILAQEDDSLPPPQEQPAGDLSPARGVDQDVEAENESPPPALLEAANSWLFLGDDDDDREDPEASPDTDPCHDPKALPHDLQGACSGNEFTRARVAQGGALEKAFETDPNKSWPVLAKLAWDKFWQVRYEAAGVPLKIAIEKDPNKSWPLLAKLADDDYGDVRLAAAGPALVAAVEKVPDKAFPLLVNLSNDNIWHIRREAAGPALAVAVEKIPDKAFPLLVNLSKDSYEFIRATAAGRPLEIAMETDPNKSWPLLDKLACDDDSHVRRAAAGSLATAIKQEPDKVFPLLVNQIKYNNYERVREFAGGLPLAAAFDKKPNESLPLLRRALGDPWENVRVAAAGDALLEAVQHMPFEDAEALIQSVTNDTDVEVVKSAGRATAWVAKEQAKLLGEAQAKTKLALGEAEKAKAKTELALGEAEKAKDTAEYERNIAKEAQAKADEEKVKAENAQAETVKQMDITARALDDAKQAKAESDANLQWNHWLQRIMAILVVVFIGLLILAWNGQRMLTEYQERNRQERIKAQVNARTTATATSHKFFFVDANMIRGWQGGPIPHFQSLMPLGWLIEKTWDLGEAIRGMYNEDYLIISHRWYSPQHPDPTGEKVKELQKFLKKNPNIRYVWMDFWSLPQSKEGRRTEEEEVTFRLGLANIFMLFISAQVLVLFDMQYAGRFWTSYELWLSLRTITAQGLESTPAHSRRATMVCMGASNQAAEKNKDSMHETWAEKSPEEAAAVLGAEDIVVTNKKDKDQQLNVLRELAANAAAIFMRCVG